MRLTLEIGARTAVIQGVTIERVPAASPHGVSFRSAALGVASLAAALGLIACRSERPSEPDAGAVSSGAHDASTVDAGGVDAGRSGSGSAGAGGAGPGGSGLGLPDAGSVFQPGSAGSDAGVGDAGGATPESYEATIACIEYMRGLCERSARCQGSPSSIDACMANARFCPDVMYAPGSTRTPEATLACADDWRELSCDALPARPACVTPGTRAPGEPCISAMQCASLTCTAYGDSCGVCGDVVGEGDACDLDANIFCGDGLTCTTDEPRRCVPLEDPSLGQASRAAQLGDECELDPAQCYPNDCRPDSDDVFRCESYPTLGQSCSDTLTCAFDDSYCDVSQLCTAFPAIGSTCGIDAFTGELQWCGAGATCVESENGLKLCQALPGPGDLCTTSCLEGRLCLCDDGGACQTRHCGRWRSPGESCDVAGDRCLTGSCADGTCRAGGERGLFQSACGL